MKALSMFQTSPMFYYPLSWIFHWKKLSYVKFPLVACWSLKMECNISSFVNACQYQVNLNVRLNLKFKQILAIYRILDENKCLYVGIKSRNEDDFLYLDFLNIKHILSLFIS